MKVSELIEKLQDELTHFGDKDVVFSCNCVDSDEPLDVGAIGWYGDAREGKERSAIMLVCSECDYLSRIEKHMFDGDESHS